MFYTGHVSSYGDCVSTPVRRTGRFSGNFKAKYIHQNASADWTEMNLAIFTVIPSKCADL